MPTINQVARERRRIFEGLKRIDRTIDTIQEAIQRRIARVITRRRDFPTVTDVDEVIELTIILDGAVETLTNALDAAATFFKGGTSVEIAGVIEDLQSGFQDLFAGHTTGRNIIALRNRNTGAIIVLRFDTEKDLRKYLDEHPQWEFAYDVKQGGGSSRLIGPPE